MSEHARSGGGFFGWVSRHPRPAFWATLVAALVVGIGVGVLAAVLGGGAQSTGGDAAALADERAGREAAERRLRETRDGTREAGGRGSEARPAPPPSPGKVQTFSGNGGKSLGTIKVPTESVLEWTTDGALFQVFTSSGDTPAPVNSQGGSGNAVLSKGDYDEFKVNALGNWTMKIRPR